MRTLSTKTHVYHYLLSFNTRTLIDWYNNDLCDPFGDYSEQIIRDLDGEGEKAVKNLLSIETLIEVGRNPKTNFTEDSIYFALTGGDKPYLLSFDNFEEFLQKMTSDDRDGLLDYIMENPEYLESLEEKGSKPIE